MPDQSLRNVSIDDFKLPPRPERGDIETDKMMGEKEKNRIQRILSLHRNGFSIDEITQRVFCNNSRGVAAELEIPLYELDRVGYEDASGMERSPAERADDIYASRRAIVAGIIERYGDSEAEPMQKSIHHKRPDCGSQHQVKARAANQQTKQGDL